MSKQAITRGDVFHKAGRPRILWAVERYNANGLLAHVVLARVDDPTTQITVSAIALANPHYFRRSSAAMPPKRIDARAFPSSS